MQLNFDLSDIQVEKAIDYNRKHAPRQWLCQSSWELVDPLTEAGVEWIAYFQHLMDDASQPKKRRVVIDGMFGGETASAYAYRFGPLRMEPHHVHRFPVVDAMWRYDHCYSIGEVEWPRKDPTWQAFLEADDSFDRGLLKLLTGFNPKTGEFNRWPSSVISLDTLSVGCFHYWAKTLAEHLPLVLGAGSLPASTVADVARQAFGEDLADTVVDARALRAFLEPRKGKHDLAFRLQPIAAGWRIIMQRDDMIQRHVDDWFDNYIGDAHAIIQRQGWGAHLQSEDGSLILAAVTRMRNSGSADQRIRSARDRVGHGDPVAVLKNAYMTDRDEGGYGKPNRWRKLTAWPEFRGPVPRHRRA